MPQIPLNINKNFPEKDPWCIATRLLRNRHQVESYHLIQCTSLGIPMSNVLK